LAIAAAAVLKAQAAASDVTAKDAALPTDATPAPADAEFAALIASATPAAGKASGKTTGKTEASATATTEGKPDAKHAKTLTAADAQPVDGSPALKRTPGDAKPDATAADGAKPDANAAGSDAPKPAGTSHEHRAEQAAAAPTPDLLPQASDPVQPPQLQPTTQTAVTAAQLTATVATNNAVPLNGVAVEIAQSAKAGKSSFEIRLDPAELGRIDVRLDVDKHGNVTSHLTVEKPETLTMLRQDAPQLQRALEQAGLKTGDGGMQFSLRDQSSGQQQNNGDQSGRNAHRLIVSEDDSAPLAPVARGYGRMLGSSSGVDISI
jgi:chemotaxis protein MotD